MAGFGIQRVISILNPFKNVGRRKEISEKPKFEHILLGKLTSDKNGFNKYVDLRTNELILAGPNIDLHGNWHKAQMNLDIPQNIREAV